MARKLWLRIILVVIKHSPLWKLVKDKQILLQDPLQSYVIKPLKQIHNSIDYKGNGDLWIDEVHTQQCWL